MDVQVLGMGCANCHKLEGRTREALTRLGAPGSVELVTDPTRIVAAGVMGVPALVVDGSVVMSGRVPEVDELVTLLGATVA